MSQDINDRLCNIQDRELITVTSKRPGIESKHGVHTAGLPKHIDMHRTGSLFVVILRDGVSM